MLYPELARLLGYPKRRIVLLTHHQTHTSFLCEVLLRDVCAAVVRRRQAQLVMVHELHQVVQGPIPVWQVEQCALRCPDGVMVQRVHTRGQEEGTVPMHRHRRPQECAEQCRVLNVIEHQHQPWVAEGVCWCGHVDLADDAAVERLEVRHAPQQLLIHLVPPTLLHPNAMVTRQRICGEDALEDVFVAEFSQELPARHHTGLLAQPIAPVGAQLHQVLDDGIMRRHDLPLAWWAGGRHGPAEGRQLIG
mmetsp:Transcript_39820/g.113558  ORF Transcript_39820/g.113558 Transcript_39820/m.113558 type:complete len:248 (-) Transcript_39820:209-952(-)